MAQRFILKIDPPVGGIVRSTAYQKQPPFTAYDSTNFWPIDPKTGRLTTSTRPGFTQLTAPSGTVTMLEQISGFHATKPFISFSAAIAGAIYYWDGTQLVAASGAQAGDVDTDRQVYAAPVTDKLYITKDGAKPIEFDYPNGTAATLVESAGTCPSNTRIAVNWQGALVLAGRLEQPQIMYMSRVGDATDWDFSVGPEDLFGAFFTDSDYKGVLSGPITALMPQTSDVLLIGTSRGTLALRGHPRQGGVFEPVGNTYPLGQGAWAQLPGDRILMLTPQGMMSIDPHPGAVVSQVSRQKIPDDLMGLLYDYDDPNVSMIYDPRWDGVHIYVRGLQEQAWWYDLVSGGFSKMNLPSYPFALTHFPEFSTEDASGVLLGRFDGIYYLDKFSTEVIPAGVVVGPVQISEHQTQKSLIQYARVVFGRDTPTVDDAGDMLVATGTDGQDAISRLLNGEHQYSVSLSNLRVNNGVCMPRVAGHAAAFAIVSSNGDVAVEQIELNLVAAGINRMPRSTQISVTGEETTFTDSFVEFDPDSWTGYSEATPVEVPAEELPDYTHFIDLSLLPTEWWDEVSFSNGDDIRVTDGDNVQAPSTVVDFDADAETGMLIFRMTQPTTPKSVRLWVGNPSAGSVADNSTYGKDNVFDDDWRSFFYNGAGTSNLTKYGTNTETDNFSDGVSGALVQGGEDGPMGASATNFDVGDGAQAALTYWLIADWATTGQSLQDQLDWSFIAAVKRTNNDVTTSGVVMRIKQDVGVDGFYLRTVQATDLSVSKTTGVVDDNSVWTATSPDSSTSGLNNWHHKAVTLDNGDVLTAYINGNDGVDVNITEALEWVDLENLTVGSDGTENVKGHVAIFQIHTATRNDAWVQYQSEMMDQVNFWGEFGDFVLVNEQEPVVELTNTAACPTGEESVSETGTWSGYAEATPARPDGTLPLMPMYIDLSRMPASWWTAVDSSDDIRATDQNNKFIPLDVVDFDSVAETGFVVVGHRSPKDADVPVRLWVGNTSAVAVSKCASYGQYSVYDNNFRAFYPAGIGNDRTQWLNHTTSTGSLVEGNTTNGTGSKATTFDADASTDQYATATASLPTDYPITIMALAKLPSGETFTEATMAGLNSTNNTSGVFLRTAVSDTPARLTVRSLTSSEVSAGNSTAITTSGDWLQGGFAHNQSSRQVLVDGGGSTLSPLSSLNVSGLDQFVIGAEVTSGVVTRNFDGDLSLVSLHTVARSTTWQNYFNDMTDQATFWGTWTWTADSNTLPQ